MNAQVRAVIAVVDDDPKILESLGDLLESAGYDVRTHSSGSSLLASGVSDVDCLITDLCMPAMDGFELRERVKQVRPELPVFLISGRGDSADETQLDGHDDTALFRKPCDGPALLAAIRRALQETKK